MNLVRPLIVALHLAGGLSLTASGLEPERPVIYVSIAPQAWILEQLGAAEVCEVRVLLPAASGHVNYSPTPSQIRNLARARLFVRSGLPFEERIWPRVRGVNPDMVVIGAPEFEAQLGEGHDHGRHEHDPHFWLDPMLMLAQAEEIAAALPSVCGVTRNEVALRLAQVRTRILDVDAGVRQRLAASGRDAFWTFHGSWGHFAEHYGLEQHAIEFEGKESGLRTMTRIVGELESSGADFIVVEPGLDEDRLSVLGNEVDLRFVELNPMRRDYDQNLLDIATAIAEGGR